MAVEWHPDFAREVVAIFHTPEDLETAIDHLLSSGFDRATISLLASELAVEEKLGHRYINGYTGRRSHRATYGLCLERCHRRRRRGADRRAVLCRRDAHRRRCRRVRWGIRGSTCCGRDRWRDRGLIASILARRVGRHRAQYFEEQMEHGGLLVWVRTTNPADQACAMMILKDHAGDGVHVHGRPDAA